MRQRIKQMRAEPILNNNGVRRGRSCDRLAKRLQEDARRKKPAKGLEKVTFQCEEPPEEDTPSRGRTMMRARPKRKRSGRGLRVKLVDREEDAPKPTNGVSDIYEDPMCGGEEDYDIRDDISEPPWRDASDCEGHQQDPRTRRGRTEHREGWGYRLHPTCPVDDPYFRWRYWWLGWRRHTKPWVQPRVWPSWG